MIKIKHLAGFFSCCSVKLQKIVEFINSNKRLPDIVDSSQLFTKYKNNENKKKDITFHYFQNYNDISGIKLLYPIRYHRRDQFKKYNNLNYKRIIPLIKKYFSPSNKIKNIVNNIENKYNIVYDNTLAVYYRGTDKKKETKLAPFNEFYKKILEIVNINKNIKILIQSDSARFIDFINNRNLKNVFRISENRTSYLNKGIHYQQSNDKNYLHMFNFLSTILILSKCKYIICGSGNCSIWTMFYRGNSKNIIQYLKGKWFNSVF